jgi:hypothetical protein
MIFLETRQHNKYYRIKLIIIKEDTLLAIGEIKHFGMYIKEGGSTILGTYLWTLEAEQNFLNCRLSRAFRYVSFYTTGFL